MSIVQKNIVSSHYITIIWELHRIDVRTGVKILPPHMVSKVCLTPIKDYVELAMSNQIRLCSVVMNLLRLGLNSCNYFIFFWHQFSLGPRNLLYPQASGSLQSQIRTCRYRHPSSGIEPRGRHDIKQLVLLLGLGNRRETWLVAQLATWRVPVGFA